MDLDVSFSEDTFAFGVKMYDNPVRDCGCAYHFIPEKNTVAFGKLPYYRWFLCQNRNLERPVELVPVLTHLITVIVDDDICMLYVDGVANVSIIQQFYNWMASASQRGHKKDLNIRTVQRINGFTSRTFKVAKEIKLIEDTPFKSTLLTIHTEAAGHHKPLPDEEIQRVMHELLSLVIPRDRIYMALLAYIGMRL